MTLMKTGAGLILAGILLAVFGAGAELRAINQALTQRIKASIALVLLGIAFVVVGLRLQGQIVFRRVTRPLKQWLRRRRGQASADDVPGGDTGPS